MVNDRVPASPAAALREISYWLDRSRSDSRRSVAFRTAARLLDEMTPEEYAQHREASSWSDVPGIGPSSTAVIEATLAGRVPDHLAKVRASAKPLTTGGRELRSLLRGDLHCHTEASDGSAPLEEMVVTAQQLGHEYLLITDHSPRLTVAHGLTAERLAAQGELIDAVNEVSDVRVLKGIEVDILDTGALDQSPAALAALDVVVASVHSKLSQDAESMTHRMVAAVANPRTNVLGHCTGRLVEGDRGLRNESRFDAEVVFEACRQFGVAVEINSRPERRDPPSRLLALARDIGCLFSIDTDAHAPGQLEFLDYGCERAQDMGIDADRIVNTWPLPRLLEWAKA
ncbi:MAG: PHP domain-containing protein [Propionibacteriaceae bacterium]